MVSSYPHHTPLYKHELNCEDVIHNPILYKRLGPFILMCVHSFIYGTIVAAGWKQIHVILFQAHFHWYFCLKRLFFTTMEREKRRIKVHMAPKTTTSTARALLLQKCGMEKKKKGSAISNISICNQTYEYIITEDKNVHVNAKESKQYCWMGAFSCSLFLLKHIPVLDGIICQGSSGTLL